MYFETITALVIIYLAYLAFTGMRTCAPQHAVTTHAPTHTATTLAPLTSTWKCETEAGREGTEIIIKSKLRKGREEKR
jgi:hypothetical protein